MKEYDEACAKECPPKHMDDMGEDWEDKEMWVPAPPATTRKLHLFEDVSFAKKFTRHARLISILFYYAKFKALIY